MGGTRLLTGPVCGSSELACRYRIHENNIFSRKEKYDYPGILAQERAKVKYAAFRERTNIHMLQDVERAGHDGLTEWSEDDIRELELFLMRKLHGTQVRANWWNVSLYEKIHRIRSHKGKADFLVRDWALPVSCRSMSLPPSAGGESAPSARDSGAAPPPCGRLRNASVSAWLCAPLQRRAI